MSDPQNVNEVWLATLGLLNDPAVLTAQQRSFVRLITPLGVTEDIVFLQVSEDFTKNVVESQIRHPITEALSDVLGRDVRFVMSVDSSIAASTDSIPQPVDNPVVIPATTPPTAATPTEDPHLNPRYIFDTFVPGASNRFAHAAALAVAESPGKTYNPLFIYGDSEIGRAHV